MPISAFAALATEDPEPSLLLEQPHGKNEPLINRTMWKHLVIQAAYQLVILFLVIYAAPKVLYTYKQPSPCLTYSNVDGHVSQFLLASPFLEVICRLYLVKQGANDCKGLPLLVKLNDKLLVSIFVSLDR